MGKKSSHSVQNEWKKERSKKIEYFLHQFLLFSYKWIPLPVIFLLSVIQDDFLPSAGISDTGRIQNWSHILTFSFVYMCIRATNAHEKAPAFLDPKMRVENAPATCTAHSHARFLLPCFVLPAINARCCYNNQQWGVPWLPKMFSLAS